MKYFLNISPGFLLFCLAFMTQASAQQFCGDFVIDDFSLTSGQALQTNPQNPLDQLVDDGGPATLGQFRTLTLGPHQGGTLNSTAIIFSNPEPVLTLSNDVGVTSPLTVLYDADGAGLNANLSGRELLNLDFSDIDNPVEFTIMLTDGNSNSSSLAISLLDSNPGPSLVEFLFDDFSGIQSVDLADIFSIEVFIQPLSGSTDIELNSVTLGCRGTPPEFVAVPTLSRNGYLVMALLLLSLGMLWTNRFSGKA